MQKTLLDYWWVPLVRGILAILFGALVLAWPGISILVFLSLIAAFWIVEGACSMYYATAAKNRGWPFWGGLISVVAGVGAIAAPGIAAISILIIIAAWAIVRGLLDIYAAIKFHREIDFEWWLALSGVVSIVFGALVLRNPAAGALAMATLIGAFTLAIGVVLVLAGFRIRAFRNKRRPMGV
ncbi:MAG: HdeD family acid-resistance protein [Steroidobacteraceae bacterium]